MTGDLPQILLVPAYHKRPPYMKYIGEGIAGPILKYIEKNVDNKFRYPVDVSKVGYPREDLNKTIENNETTGN